MRKILLLILIFLHILSGASSLYAAGDNPNDLTSENFQVPVNIITPWVDDRYTDSWGSQWMVNELLNRNIRMLLIIMWSVALITMTVWAGYMIFPVWQEENLNKWKSIFTSGLIALVIALSSYMIIAFVRYILYST